jgi:hypothetical protein
MFNGLARMQLPANFDPQMNQSVMAYHPMQIRRVSTYEFRAGRLPRHAQSRGLEPSAVITR